MLNKRFKIAKCKTSLKLATSRIKLMRNKKGVQITQMKKELAQLLESGQDRTARIRVEHVIREEKMVAAYDLIEIYCELIVARLPIIESQKTCPVDLKEAVASVIFAAPRCSDIPELVDARKNFTAKYGKEFVSAALEVCPDCGVNRMLIEKLSAVAPDVQTKVKVLTTVAKEHNINWDPTIFEDKESRPPDDLLNGQTNFVQTSTINPDPPQVQTSNVHNIHNHVENPNVPIDFSQQNRRFTRDDQNVSTADSGSNYTSSTSTTRDDTRPSGMASGMMNTSQSFHRNNSGSSSWNMEFKDATHAAQAAAESAERASFAARAAAQLSSQGKINRQYSNESYDSYTKNERPQVSPTSEFPDQRHLKDSYNTSFNDRKPKIQNPQTISREYDTSPKATEYSYADSHGSTKTKRSNSSRSRNEQTSSREYDTSPKAKEYSYAKSHGSTKRSNSLRSKNESFNESSVNHLHQEDEYIETHEKTNHSHETRSKKEPKSRFKSGDDVRSSKSEKVVYDTEEVIEKKPSITSSRSHFSNIGAEREVLTSGRRVVVEQGNRFREGTKTYSYDDSHRDDETDSDDDHHVFDSGFDFDEEEAAKSFFPSPGRESIRPVENPQIWSPKKNTKKVNSAKSVDHSVKSDLSDGPDSESESETSFSGTNKFTSSRKHDTLSTKSSPKVNSTKSRIELNDLVERDSSFNKTYDNQSDDSDIGKDLKFGTLAGGLRNKGGVKYPPYKKSDNKRPVKVELIEPTPKQSSFNSRARRSESKKPSVSISSSDSDSDYYSKKKFPIQSPKTRSSFAPPDTFFNNNETDSEEEMAPVPKSTSGKVNVSSVVSLRTKGKTGMSKQSPPEQRHHTTRFKQEPSETTPEPKVSKQPSVPSKKIVEPSKTEAPKTPHLTPQTSFEGSNGKKPSHVHPNLPEYDSLAARIQFLHANHQ